MNAVQGHHWQTGIIPTHRQADPHPFTIDYSKGFTPVHRGEYREEKVA